MHALVQRFSIPVLAPPCSAYFVCYSYRFRCLFYLNVSALRSGHHRIFRHDSSSKRTYIFHSKCIEVGKTWIKIVYIYRGIWCHTRPCVKTLRSANPWINVPKWSKLQRISPAQGVGSNGPCVGSMSIGTQFMHDLTSWLSESGVLTKRDMQNMRSGGARGLELRTSALVDTIWFAM